MQRIALSDIHIRPDARAIDASTVAALAESMKEIGLLNPVRVRATDPGFELCAGNHRYEAAVSLGWSEIDAIVEEFDDLDAELVMIDENLCRAELSAADRAQYTARRKAIYLEKHPETAHGGDRRSDQVAKFATRNDSFTADTAKKTGESERVVRLHAERGEKVAADVLKRVKGSFLDNGVYLDGLKKLSHDDQRAKVERDIQAGVKRQERRRRKPEPALIITGETPESPQPWAALTFLARSIAEIRMSPRELIDSCPNVDALDDLQDACELAATKIVEIVESLSQRTAA
jgi:ParB-like chromosome segregation protein Spo0J